MKCGGPGFRPGLALPASHWNFTGEPGFLMSFGPGAGRSLRKSGIIGQVVGNGPLAKVTGAPATLTKNNTVPVGPPVRNVDTPVVAGAWTSTSARLPPASASPPGT